jgi:hypothetical protein
VVLEARDTLLAVVVPALKVETFLRRGKAIARKFRVNRPARPMQMSQAAEYFKSLG